jgi:hypothetical protein
MKRLIPILAGLFFIVGCGKKDLVPQNLQQVQSLIPSLTMNFPEYPSTFYSGLSCIQVADTITFLAQSNAGTLFIQFQADSLLTGTVYNIDGKTGNVVFYNPFGYPIATLAGTFQLYINSSCNSLLVGNFSGSLDVTGSPGSSIEPIEGNFSYIPYSYTPIGR